MPFDLTEGDVIAIFSQFGEPVYINLVRDKESGKSKGFAFLKYEDQRSTDLAVDNLGGATVLGRVLKVDHTRYKKKEDEEGGNNTGAFGGIEENGKQTSNGSLARRGRESMGLGEDGKEKRPQLKEEKELERLIRDHDEEDPMKEYLVQEKKADVAQALTKLKQEGKNTSDRKRKHHHRHSSRKDDERDRRAEDGHTKQRHRKDR